MYPQLVVLAFGTLVLDPTGEPTPRLRAQVVREELESTAPIPSMPVCVIPLWLESDRSSPSLRASVPYPSREVTDGTQMLVRGVTEQPTPPGFRGHHFMDRSIDLPANLTEVQLDGRACIRYGAEDQPTRPVETWSELSRQLFGRYPERAARCRELATWIEDEYRALSGGHQRKVPLDDRGMFPGALAA